MPGGDGTGPMGYGPGMGWGGGRWGCRGPFYRGGHGWRNRDRAAGPPGWMRGGWWGRSDVPATAEIAPAPTEESLLRRQAEMLESELRWIRGRLEAIGGSSASED